MAKEAEKTLKDVQVNPSVEAGTTKLSAADCFDLALADVEQDRELNPYVMERATTLTTPKARKAATVSTMVVKHRGGVNVVLVKKCWYHDRLEVVQSSLTALRAEYPELGKVQGCQFSETSERASGFADSCKEGNRQYSACRNRANATVKEALRQLMSARQFPPEKRAEIIEGAKALKTSAKEQKAEKLAPVEGAKALAFSTRQEAITWAKKMGLEVVGE